MIFCLEGPSCAGKTTTIRRLQELHPMPDTLFLKCYVENFLRVQDIPPPRTGSAGEQLAAFHLFMEIEAERFAQAATGSYQFVILDRSVDTLMAHAYALDFLYDFNV